MSGIGKKEDITTRIAEIEAAMMQPDFWSDKAAARDIIIVHRAIL